MKTITLLATLTLSTLVSCTPTTYIADLRTYSKQIEADPSAVNLKPEHVTPVGGFQAEIGAKVLTDAGEINISNDGVSGHTVVDLRSGK